MNAEPVVLPRVLADLGDDRGGATLLVTAGVHGNEPGGVVAAQRVALELERRGTPLAGRYLALAGNLRALRARRRYLHEDLNRLWDAERVERCRAGARPRSAEDEEMRELLAHLDEALLRRPSLETVRHIDLHGTSGAGLPFSIPVDPAHGPFADLFPIPQVLGMEDMLLGTLAAHMAMRGVVTLAVEGGQNDRPDTAEALEAVLWVALVAQGIVAVEDVADLGAKAAWLRDHVRDAPKRVWVDYRHEIRQEDRFRMEPGFANLQRVAPGELIARDRKREWRAKTEAYILFPLYQGQGNDGFFLAREASAED